MRKLSLVLAAVIVLALPLVALAASPPTVSTLPATNVTNTSATLNGTVNPNGQSTTYWFQYGTTTGYGSQTPQVSAGSGSSTQGVSASVSGLNPGTTYHFRILAQNSSGTRAGSDMTFTTTGTAPTAGPPPAVTTGSATAIKRNGATLNGTVNPQGSTTSWRFEYGLTAFYGTQTVPQTISGGTANHSVSATLRGLQSGKTYHYRLVATNSNGTIVGTDRTFRTGPPRVAPKRVTAHTTPRHATTFPFTFTTSGKIVPPSNRNRSRACRGFVAVRFQAGTNTISLRRARVHSNCTYSSRVTFHNRSRLHPKRLRVTLRFQGNAVLAAKFARAQFVTAG